MRRPALLVSILLLAGVLLIRLRRRHARVGALAGGVPTTPLAPPVPAALPPGAPRATGTRFLSVPWELVAAPDDEPTLTIRYRSDERMEFDRVDAQETPTQLFVTVLLRGESPVDGWAALADEREAVVPLSQPLGERELVHSPVDEPGDRPLYP